MKKMINTERIEGRVYQHNLTIKTVQNQTSANFGKEFISGQLEVAVDEEGLNIAKTMLHNNKKWNSSFIKKIVYLFLQLILVIWESPRQTFPTSSDQYLTKKLITTIIFFNHETSQSFQTNSARYRCALCGHPAAGADGEQQQRR